LLSKFQSDEYYFLGNMLNLTFASCFIVIDRFIK